MCYLCVEYREAELSDPNDPDRDRDPDDLGDDLDRDGDGDGEDAEPDDAEDDDRADDLMSRGDLNSRGYAGKYRLLPTYSMLEP